MKNEPITKVGVLGAGIMGSQIAELMAFNGFSVLVKDISQNVLKRSRQIIRNAITEYVDFHSKRAEREIAGLEKSYEISLSESQKNVLISKFKSQVNEDLVDRVLSKIEFTEKWTGFDEVGLILESIPEEIELKRKVFVELGTQISESTIIGTNTSTLSTTELASFTNRPQNCIGTHFMNPVWTLPLIELVRGIQTSSETFERTENFLTGLRNHRGSMKPINVSEIPGFVANRILRALWAESFSLVDQGVATPENIDQIMKLGAGFRLGPFEMADFAGLDIVYHIDRNIREMEGGNVTNKAPQIIKKMVLSGNLGRKTGRGFYQY